MASTVMKVEIESESCCVCGSGGDLMTPEEHDVGAPPMQMPLRSMLLHLNNSKVVPDGRLCASCIRRTLDAYEFSTALSSRAVPPLSEKIRALRRRLHELTQKIDVFIVVGGPGVNAGGAYSEEDIIMVERGALAAAAAADDDDLEKARNAKGDTVYQCSVCPLSFQRVSEYRAHARTHGADALHSCWTCGAQFAARDALRAHKQQHHHDRPDLDHDLALVCHLCDTTFQELPDVPHPQVPRVAGPAAAAGSAGAAAAAAGRAAAAAGVPSRLAAGRRRLRGLPALLTHVCIGGGHEATLARTSQHHSRAGGYGGAGGRGRGRGGVPGGGGAGGARVPRHEAAARPPAGLHILVAYSYCSLVQRLSSVLQASLFFTTIMYLMVGALSTISMRQTIEVDG